MEPAASYAPFRLLEIVEALDVEALLELHAYWQSKRGPGIAPPRRAIEPAEIRGHLPNIFILDVLGRGADYRCRLVGTGLAAALGRDSTGQLLSDIHRAWPDTLRALLSLFGHVVREKRPIFARGEVFWTLKERDYRRFEAVYLPLSEDGATVDMILGENFFFFPPGG